MITISEERLKELEMCERELRALNNAGIDNWEFYDIALEEIRKEEELDKKFEDLSNEILEMLCDGIQEMSERGAGYGFADGAGVRLEKMLKEKVKELN